MVLTYKGYSGIVNHVMTKKKPKKANLEPKTIDDYSPGATRDQFFEALKAVSVPKEKPIEKLASKPAQA
jgi:hypothetical protein